MSDAKECFEGGEAPCSEATIESSVADSPAEMSASMQGEMGGNAMPSLEEMRELLAPDLSTLLAQMAAALQDQSWRYLGLVANPVTQTVDKDLPKAKIAIDVFAFIVNQVSPMLSEGQRRDLQNQVATLQMNFVEQGRRG